MSTVDIWLIVSLVVLITLSAFFSASETAFSSINAIKLKNLVNNGSRKAERALALTDKYDSLLTTILIGNNVVNLAAASIATVLFTDLLHDDSKGALISTIVITIVVLIFGEISPKTIAREVPEKTAMKFAPVLSVLIIIFKPLTVSFEKLKTFMNDHLGLRRDSSITEGEFLTMVEEAKQDGGIDASDSELIHSVIGFNDMTSEDILVPRVDVVAIPKDASRREVTELFNKYEFTRLPVYDGTIDNITGFIHQKDYVEYVMSKKKTLEQIVKPIIFVLPSMKIVNALKLLQKKHTHMAVVADEFGGTEGIITMEDILEELVGEIWDEHDEEIKEYEKVSENEYKIMCTAFIDTFFDYFGIKCTTDETTVGGWVIEQLEKIPVLGDSFDYGNITVTVSKTDPRRALEVIVRVNPQTDDEKEHNDDTNKS